MNSILLALVLFVLAFVFLYFRAKNSRGPKAPPLHIVVPYVGNMISFGKHPLNYLKYLNRKYGDIFTFQALGKNITFLTGPEGHAAFFKGTDEQMDQNEPYSFSVPIFGPNIVYGCDLKLRNQQLKFMRGSLKTDRMRLYVGEIIKETESFFDERWVNEGEVDLRHDLAELIILTASRCLMGPEVRERMVSKVATLFQQLDEGLTPLSFFFPYAPIEKHRIRDKARIEMASMFRQIMEERLQNPDVERNDVLQVFMDAEYSDGRKLQVEEVSGLMIALLFAGQHTSSVTSSWAGLLLLNDREALERVFDEQKKVLDKHGELNYDALQEMDVLHRSIKETLRMFPPLILLMRKLMVDLQVKDYIVPKGDTVFLSPSISGRHPAFFENPDKYDPERFSAERAEDKKTPYAFIGFGEGRHGCLGETFAYLQIKTIWSVLFRKYELTLVGGLPEVDYTALVVGPRPSKVHYRKL